MLGFYVILCITIFKIWKGSHQNVNNNHLWVTELSMTQKFVFPFSELPYYYYFFSKKSLCCCLYVCDTTFQVIQASQPKL